uniref:SAM-dependent MTase RsmB/NOP-type domain-containing protein n=1 Tax=Chaetoceros debilis TaxID=122233 RepID=A0A6S8TNW3_9STRA
MASNNEGDNDGNDGNDDDINADDGMERLQNLLPLQQHILSRAARLVKPGGRLASLYHTCSLLPKENEHQIENFMGYDEGEVSRWRLDPPKNFVAAFEAGGESYLRLTSAQHGTDGFFAAVLRRNEEN